MFTVAVLTHGNVKKSSLVRSVRLPMAALMLKTVSLESLTVLRWRFTRGRVILLTGILVLNAFDFVP